MAYRVTRSLVQGPRPSSDAVVLMEYDASKKSPLVAYLFWFFLGYLGGHRFYLGRVGSGLVMLAFPLFWIVAVLLFLWPRDPGSFALIGGFLVGAWWLIDALRIPGMVASHNRRLITRLIPDHGSRAA